MTQVRTYSPKNEVRITCPVFGSEQRLADCLELEQQVARGKRSPERKGCQACLSSSKCPTYWIIRNIQRTGDDPYWSAEPKLVPLKGEILDAVAPIQVRDDHINYHQVEGEELEAIRAANEAASSGARARTSRKVAPVKLAAVQKEEPKKAVSSSVMDAAISGDLSAAVTKAVEKASAKPAEPVQPAPAPLPAPTPPKPAQAAPVATKPAPAPAGKGMSLLELARARAKAAA